MPIVYCSLRGSERERPNSATIALSGCARHWAVASMTSPRNWVAKRRESERSTRRSLRTSKAPGSVRTRKRSRIATVIPSQTPPDMAWATMLIHSMAAGVGVHPPSSELHTDSAPNRAMASEVLNCCAGSAA